VKPDFVLGYRLTLRVAAAAALLCVLVRCEKDDVPNAKHDLINTGSPELVLAPGTFQPYRVTVTSKMMLKDFPPYIEADGVSVDSLDAPDSLPFTCVLVTEDNANNWVHGTAPTIRGDFHTRGYKGCNTINYTFNSAGTYYVIYRNDTTVENIIDEPEIQLTWFYYGTDSTP